MLRNLGTIKTLEKKICIQSYKSYNIDVVKIDLTLLQKPVNEYRLFNFFESYIINIE